jgi:RNA polymerase sigma-70 factor (ECF subfamily)
MELLEAWRAGDRDASEELVGRYFEAICRFFRAKLGGDVAQDLIQRTFLDCVESRDRVEDGGFRAYLFRVAKHRLYDHLRAEHRRPAAAEISLTSLADLATSPSQRVARNEEEKLLGAALRRIPLEYQIALELAYWEAMSGPEIAAVLEIPANTVRAGCARARDAVREQIELLAASPAAGRDTLRTLDAALD